ncbi:MAG TPA: DinB family protein [Bryobacteraceae bacterium]|jgi:uncharacterized damage-inducible protein DinB|nr:DinB family protein [Bryobacteraceae bacterium]
MPFSQTLLLEFDDEMKKTRKILERVPDDKFDYKPHEKSMSLGRLATHIADLPNWAVVTIDQDVLDMQPGYKPHVATTQDELLDIFDKNVATASEKIAGATDEHWNQIWTFKFSGKTMMALPRTAVMRGMVMNHIIHHRGQLGVYLRLNDVAVPGMYGPSADEQAFFTAQNA